MMTTLHVGLQRSLSSLDDSQALRDHYLSLREQHFLPATCRNVPLTASTGLANVHYTPEVKHGLRKYKERLQRRRATGAKTKVVLKKYWKVQRAQRSRGMNVRVNGLDRTKRSDRPLQVRRILSLLVLSNSHRSHLLSHEERRQLR